MRNIRRTIDNILNGVASLLNIMPPEIRVRFSFSPLKYNGRKAYRRTSEESDWYDLGRDMRAALGYLEKTYRP
ncbi:MAG: hypothetical protein AABY02_04475 [Nanoarchaeota archaeon]